MRLASTEIWQLLICTAHWPPMPEAITAVDQIGDGHEMGLVSTFEIGVSEAVILGAVRQSMLVEKIDNGMTCAATDRMRA